MSENPNIIKVVILGSSGVGKSSLLFRYVTNGWDANIQATLGAAFMDKSVQHKGRTLKLQIWDTAGQEKYAPLAQMYYRDADVAILVYDCTNKESFSNLRNWHMELGERGPRDIILSVVGNKSDLKYDEQVSPEEGKAFAKDCDALFGTTSAKENTGINEIFNQICDKLIAKNHIMEDKEDYGGKKKLEKGGGKKTQSSGGSCC